MRSKTDRMLWTVTLQSEAADVLSNTVNRKLKTKNTAGMSHWCVPASFGAFVPVAGKRRNEDI